ncbi:MAG: response regulator [Pseudomonadota bacterium]
MPERLEDLFLKQKPTADQPLRGQTILAVEDSRFASEALRLLCLRSGARIRRADSVASALRHLSVYRPSVALVDPGLPDGSGIDLIRELKSATPPVPIVIAISGDPDAETDAQAAGADGFLSKPVDSLVSFQSAILRRLAPHARPRGPRAIADDGIAPDRLAFQDDLALIADQLATAPDPGRLHYIAQFLSGLARTAGDKGLAEAADALATLGQGALATRRDAVLGHVSQALDQRLAERAAI